MIDQNPNNIQEGDEVKFPNSSGHIETGTVQTIFNRRGDNKLLAYIEADRYTVNWPPSRLTKIEEDKQLSLFAGEA